MLRLVIRRVIGGAITLLIAVAVAFLLTRSSGDPVRAYLGPTATNSEVARLQRHLGFDNPLVVQFWDYIRGLVRGNLGTSLQYNTSNLKLISERLPYSLELAGSAMFLAILFGIPLGTWAAVRDGTNIGRVAGVASMTGQSIPLFWLGMMLVLIFADRLHWLPAGEAGSFSNLVLPAVTLSALPFAQISRLTRASLVGVLRMPYIMAAEGRGLSKLRIIFIYALRNASLPVVTIAGLQAGTLLSGAVTVEYVFGWPGIGTLAVQAVQSRDFSLVEAIVVMGAFVFVSINLIIDLLYMVFDPRVRVARR